MDSGTAQIALLVIAGVVALALLLQALVLLGIFFGMRKAYETAQKEIDELRASALPFIQESREFINRVAPKIEATSVDVAAITHTLRLETAQLQSAANDLVQRARKQADRLDAMATSILDTADRAGSFMSSAVNKPVRQVSGVLASIKAVVETLRGPNHAPRARTNHGSGDPEMFV